MLRQSGVELSPAHASGGYHNPIAFVLNYIFDSLAHAAVRRHAEGWEQALLSVSCEMSPVNYPADESTQPPDSQPVEHTAQASSAPPTAVAPEMLAALEAIDPSTQHIGSETELPGSAIAAIMQHLRFDWRFEQLAGVQELVASTTGIDIDAAERLMDLYASYSAANQKAKPSPETSDGGDDPVPQPPGTVLLPLGGMRCLERLRALGGPRCLMMGSDKVRNAASRCAEWCQPQSWCRDLWNCRTLSARDTPILPCTAACLCL